MSPKKFTHSIMKKVITLVLSISMTAALFPAFTISASADTSPQSVRTPVETSLLSVTGAPESITVAEGHTYETALGTSPNTTVTLPTGCGYCPSMAGCGDGCLDKWSYCSCDPTPVYRTPYLELVSAGDASIAAVTLDTTTGKLNVTGLSSGTTTVQVRTAMDAPSPTQDDTQPNAYGRVSATVSIPLTVEAKTPDWTSFSLSTNHSGTVSYSFDQAAGTDDQVVTIALSYDQALKFTDQNAVNSCLESAGIYVASASNTFKSIDTGLSDDGKTFYIYGHLTAAPYGSVLTIPAIGSLTGLVSTVTGKTASLTTLGNPGPIIPNGINFQTVKQTVADGTANASVTTKITVPSTSTRSMIHILLLKNGLPAYETDTYNSNCTAHDHDYLTMTAAKFVSLLYSKTDSGTETGYLYSSFKDGYTFSTDNDTVTITAKGSSVGDVLDLRLIAYPVDRDTKADKTALEAALTAASAINTASYSADSVKALTDQIAIAKAADSSNNYTQSEIDSETAALTGAAAGLVYPAPTLNAASVSKLVKTGTNLSIKLDNASEAWINNISSVTVGTQTLDRSQYSLTISGTTATLTLIRTDDKPIVSGTGRTETAGLTIKAAGYEDVQKDLTFHNYNASTLQIRVVDGDGNIIPARTYSRSDLTSMEENGDASYQTICGMAGLRTFKAKGVLLTNILSNAGVPFTGGMTLKLRTNDCAASENDSETDNAYYSKGSFTYEDLLGQKRYYFPNVYSDPLRTNILNAGKMDDTVRNLIGTSGDAVEVTPMIGLEYTETIFRDTSGAAPSNSYSSLISNERSYRFLFGLAMDPDNTASIASVTTTWSATYCAFGIDISAPDNHDKKNTEALIFSIGTVTKDSAAAIKSARDAYDALPSYEQAVISNYSTLTAAENALADLGKVENIFTDVPAGTWYHDAVQYVYDRNIMTGMRAADFGTTVTLPRAQFVTMLYRIDGSPATVYTPKFLDVPDNAFYSLAVIWASDSSRRIVSGYNKDYFGSSDSVTREQIATILYRYANYKGYDTGKTADISNYPDAGNVSAYAKAAMEWAVGTGIISGNKGYLNPQKTAIRAECAIILMRFLMNYSS